MKKFFIILFLVGFAGLIVYYVTSNSTQCEAKAGCCSRHGGVSHCGSSGFYVCNDGTRSPSCRCK